MVIAYVKDTGKVQGSGVASVDASFGTLPSSGNAVVGGVSSWHGSANNGCTVTDNQSNSYPETINQTCPETSNENDCSLHCDPSIGSPTGTFTVTFDHANPSGNYMIAGAAEFSGMDAASAVDVTQGNNQTTQGAGDADTGVSAATDTADELLVAINYVRRADTDIAMSTPTGHTSIIYEANAANWGGVRMSYEILTSTGTQQVQWSHDSNSAWAAALATYRAAGAVSAEPLTAFFKLTQLSYKTRNV